MTLLDVFGVTNHIEWWQELPRAVVVFVFGLILLRVSGRRVFARWSALDIIVSVIMGSSLSRGPDRLGTPRRDAARHEPACIPALVVGAHGRALGALRPAGGRGAVVLGHSGTLLEREVRQHNISTTDIEEALRKEGVADVRETRQLTLEPSGNITVLKA